MLFGRISRLRAISRQPLAESCSFRPGDTTLVLWYFNKKDLRHRPGERKFLIRSSGLLIQNRFCGDIPRPEHCAVSFHRCLMVMRPRDDGTL